MTDPERHAHAEFHVRKIAASGAPESSLALFLADHDAMVRRYQLAEVENVRMRAELAGRCAA